MVFRLTGDDTQIYLTKDTCWTRGSDGYAPHTRPAGDLAYVRVGGDWAYVCLLVDLADRGIVKRAPKVGHC